MSISFAPHAQPLTLPGADVYAGPPGTGFVRLAFQREPWRVLWALRSDGVLCGMTYRQDQDVWAWHRHPRSGLVRDIAVLPRSDGTGEDLWLVVERMVSGTPARLIEIMAPPHRPADADDSAGFVYLDSTLSYAGPPVTTLSGLAHLEGQTVSVLADGVVLASREVQDAAITLDAPASQVHVGLPFTARLETLAYDGGDGAGSAAGRARAVSEVSILVHETAGGKAGRAMDALDPLFDRDGTDALDSPARLVSGYRRVAVNLGWQTGRGLTIVQDQPLPMTVLAVIPVVTRPGR